MEESESEESNGENLQIEVISDSSDDANQFFEEDEGEEDYTVGEIEVKDDPPRHGRYIQSQSSTPAEPAGPEEVFLTQQEAPKGKKRKYGNITSPLLRGTWGQLPPMPAKSRKEVWRAELRWLKDQKNQVKHDSWIKHEMPFNKREHKPVKLAPLNLTHLLMNDESKSSLRKDKNLAIIMAQSAQN